MKEKKSNRRFFCVWFHVSYGQDNRKQKSPGPDASGKGKTRVFVFRANAPVGAVERCTRTKRRSGFFPDEFVSSPFYHVFSTRTRNNHKPDDYLTTEGLPT